MARSIPENRFDDLVRSATTIFITQGYRRTQMADIADAMGLAKGTMYLYVESKEALFDLVARCADQPGPVAQPEVLPLSTPAPGATLTYVAETLAARQAFPHLQAALRRRKTSNVANELSEILYELYDTLSTNRTGLKLLDRCAVDLPDFAALWFSGARGFLVTQLISYLEARKRLFEEYNDPAVVARMVIETLVFWAVHRHWDPAPEKVSDENARIMVVRFLCNGLCRGGDEGP